MSEHRIIEILKSQLHCGQIYSAKGSGSLQFYDTDQGNFFVKISKSSLEGEFKGLKLIEKTETVRVPHPHLFGKEENFFYLIVEALDLLPHTQASQEKLGRQLAHLHLVEGPDKYGLDFDNTLGLTPQTNPWTDSWIEFFREHRLSFQLKLIKEKYSDDKLQKLGEQLLDKLPEYFKGVQIRPSLLHGDLWGGNTAALADGTPVVYDPACYFGHHEADLSMMGMFGGFTRDFFDAYHEAIPQSPGFDERIKLYQLYHYLNHYLLFGEAYRSFCQAILERY